MDSKQIELSSFQMFKAALLDVLEQSTLHGISKILYFNSLLVKAFFAVFFLAAVSGSIVLIYLTIAGYLQYNVVTSIKVFKEATSPFPAVTFCNLDLFPTSQSQIYVDALMGGNMAMGSMGDTIGLLSGSSTMAKMGMYRANQNILINQTLVDLFSIPLNETILSCTYNGMPCKLASFSSFYDMYQGQCFTFKTTEKITSPGSLNGLHLEIFLGLQNVANNYTIAKGMIVKVHNETLDPLRSEGITIAPSTENNIEIKKSFNIRLSEPYNNCIKSGAKHDSDLYKRIVKAGKTYMRSNCYDLCTRREGETVCSCFMYDFPVHTATRACAELMDQMCMGPVLTKLSQDPGKYCDEFCPEECDSVHYSLSTSQALFPTNLYAQKLIDNYPFFTTKYPGISATELKESILSFNVYYPELMYTEMTQEAQYSLTDMISSIGGSLGLCIGASLLSLLEVIHVLGVVLKYIYERIKHRNKIETTEKRVYAHTESENG